MALGIYEEEDIRAIAEEIRFCKGGGGHMTVKEMREEIPNVKEHGFSEGWSDGWLSGNGEGREQGRTEGLEEGKAIGYAEGKTDGIAEGIEQGKKSQYDEFWDAAFETYSIYAKCSFAGSMWNDRTFNPNRSIKPYQGDSFFRESYIENLKGILERNGVIFDFSKCTYFDYFAYSSKIKYFPTLDFSNAPLLASSFSYGKCESIHLIISDSGSQTFLTTFNNCKELVELIIDGGIIGQNGFNVQWSTKLSHDSLMSIINALKDNSGTDTWNTITLGADNIAKLTQEELDIMEQKHWEYS